VNSQFTERSRQVRTGEANTALSRKL
jgi:hypothetical protein